VSGGGFVVAVVTLHEPSCLFERHWAQLQRHGSSSPLSIPKIIAPTALAADLFTQVTAQRYLFQNRQFFGEPGE
jgi:hypothetical protein